MAELLALAPRILPFMEPVWERLDAARRAGRRILFEGAQAVMLDVDHGTYPFVTSSNTVAGDRGFRLWARTRPPSGSCWGSRRLIPPASAPVRSRPSCMTASGRYWATGATSSARSRGGGGAAAGSTRCWSARR